MLAGVLHELPSNTAPLPLWPTAAQNDEDGQDTPSNDSPLPIVVAADHEVPLNVYESPFTATQNDGDAHETESSELLLT
jgi:hypothetical protein